MYFQLKQMKTKLIITLLLACGLSSAHADDTKIEAENAVYSDCGLVEDSKYSGSKALDLTDGKAKITFTFNAEQSGKYNVFVCSDGIYGDKEVYISVNGSTGTFQTGDKFYGEIETGPYAMSAGENTIVITPSWTWFRIDYIRITSATSSIVFDIPAQPSDNNANESALKMYTYLYNNFGQKTISGIMTGDMKTATGDVTQHEDVQAVYNASGKYPALVGFDFMNATGKSADNNSWYKEYTDACIALAKDLYKRGGLPAFTWHWRDPSRTTDEFYSEKCTFDISSAMNADGSWNTSSALYTNIIKDIDAIADYFLQLQAEGVACIFRPLHEASGGWFWWGRNKKAEPCIKLYQLVRNEMVNVKGVHNLIWVWNPGSADDSDWNPGSENFDVVAIDIYNNDYDYSSNYVAFEKLKKITEGKKLIALSENGPIPDVDKTFDEEAVWSWWMPWYQSWEGGFVDKTSKEEWTKCMNDSRIITLEDCEGNWNGKTAIKTVNTSASGSAIYDLQGCQLKQKPAKGLYIQNNKKHIR